MSLPSLEEPDPGTRCDYCGGPIRVSGFCAECDDRLAAEKRREAANEKRRQAQIRLDEDMAAEQWVVQEERDAIEDRERDEAFHRFREDAEEFLQNAADADDHSSDVDPGRE